MTALGSPIKPDIAMVPPDHPDRLAILRPGLGGWCLAAYAFLIPAQFAVGDLLRAAPSDLFLFGYLLLRLRNVSVRRSTWTSWHGLIVLSLAIGNTVAALHDQLTLYAVVNKGIGALTLFAAYLCLVDFCHNIERVIWLCRAFLWGVLVNLVLALAALYASTSGFLNLSFINFAGVRLAGLLIDPNAFGGLLVAAIALHFLPRAAGLEIVTGVAGRILSIALPIGLILTFSRSAWIGGGVAIVIGIWRLGYRFLRSIVIVGGVLALVAVLATAVVFPNAAGLINRNEQVDGRVTILQDAFNDFSTDPITGIGVGVSIQRNGIQIHNTTMWFLTELGPLGLISLLGLVFAFAARAGRLARSRDPLVRALGVGLLGAHVGMYGVSMGIDAFYQRYWWMVFAFIAALAAQRDGANGIGSRQGG